MQKIAWTRIVFLLLLIRLVGVSCAVAGPWAAEQQAIATEAARGDGADRLQGEEVVKFTFGTPSSVTRSGFVKVTVRDAFTLEQGYGFESTDGLLAFDRGGSEIVRPGDEYTASVYGAYRMTSDLTCALIEGQSDSAFLVSLPDGEYTVWLIASDAAWDPPLFEVWANGEKKLDVRLPRARFVFMRPFQARATDGRLRIELKGPHGWIINGLVIGREGPALAETIGKIKRDIFLLTEQELPDWHEVKSEPVNAPLDWSEAERERGYVVFGVDYTEMITPSFVPSRAVMGKPLTSFAAPGEYEPATFCVLSQKELGQVTLELSDFVEQKSERRMSPENVEVGIVRCWPQRVSGWGGKGEYYVVPEMIEPPSQRTSRMLADQTKQWWLTVHVPPNTPAGRYRMSLTIRPEKGPPTTLEWRLRVLPFRLIRPEDKHWGTWLDGFPPVGGLRGPERRGRRTPAEVERLARADMDDYRAHGFDLALLNYYFGVNEDPDGSFTYSLSTLPEDMEYLKMLGSNAPVVICFEYTCRNIEYGFADPRDNHVPGTFSTRAHKAIVGLVRHIRDEAKRRNWPKIYFFPIDEPGNNKTKNRYQFAENVLDFVREVPGCETAVTVTSGCVQRLGKRVDARIYAYGYYNRDRVLQEAKQGHPFWYYENGMFYGHSTLASRGHTGFEFLRSGAEVATAWGFSATQANPHNDFDGGHKDWNVIFPGVHEPTPTIYWELCREGVDDCRYVATLQREIRRAKERGSTEAAERAERVLEPLLAADAARINNPHAFARYRWRIAREILALQGDGRGALTFAAVVDNPPRRVKLGPNLIANPSFEDSPRADGTPPGSYHLGYPTMKEKPVEALQVTEEVAHSGRYSLKWDLSKVADPQYKGRGTRWLTVNVGLSSDMVKSLRGKRVRLGYWMRLGGGTTVPGLQLRQYLKDGPGDGFYYRDGLDDPSVWNHFETEGHLSSDLESMDIHTWCSIPEARLAEESYFYMDDFSLQVIEEPPLSVMTSLDEYYIGETIGWTVSAAPTDEEVRVAMLAGDEPVEERVQKEARTLRGEFESRGLKPGIYTIEATAGAPSQRQEPARRQIIVAPNPWEE